MAETFNIEVRDQEVQDLLNQLLARTGDLSAPMADIARALANITEDAFASETSPFGEPWVPLALSTIKRREKQGTWPGKKLQVSGQLAASIASESGKDYAELSAGKVYAAIQQFGGEAGRGHAADIPARGFLPVDALGGLPEPTEKQILEILADYLVD